MKRVIPLRAVLLLLAVTGGAKLAVSMYDRSDDSMADAFDLVGPVFASKAEVKHEPAEVKLEPKQCETPEDIFLAINKERDLLNKQKTALEERRASVSLAEEKLKQDTARLSDLKKDLEGLFAKVQQAKSADLERLVKIYRGMKPQDAAKIMNTLDIEVAVMVLGQMKERDAAPIFAKLNLVRSQAISKILLERSKLPGDQNLRGIALQ